MERVRWGIIGCGDVTERKSGPGLQKAEGSALVAVMRRDRAKAADYAERHHVPRWYDDAEALIRDPEVDIVYVATPPSTHEQYCVLASAAGKPVYVEKPMARTADECRRMIAACEAACDGAGVKLFVAYYRRRLPRFVKVKQLIDDGEIGAVRAVSVRLWLPAERSDRPDGWRTDAAVSGGGLFVDLASHTLDLLDELCGPLSGAAGTAANLGRRHGVEDTVAGWFTFESGVVGSGSWCFSVGLSQDVVEIVGDRGLLRFSTFGEIPVTLQNERGEQSFDIPHPPHVQQPLIQTVVDELRGRGTCPSTGRSALRTSIVMDAMLADWRAEHEPQLLTRSSKKADA